MARLARVVIPGVPHLVTQRGNGGARVFFSEADYRLYRGWLAECCAAAGVEIWAWMLMPNHVHLILVPGDADGLRRALAPLHRRYASHVHARLKVKGHFWQGRFGAVAMDEDHLAAAMRYVAHNPVRACLAPRPQDWPWSSVHAHLIAHTDGVTAVEPVLERFPRFAEFIAKDADPEAAKWLRQAESIGRPLGSARFIAELEARTGRALRPGKPGPKPKRPASNRGDSQTISAAD